MTLKEKLQHRYALSEKGAQDMNPCIYFCNDLRYCSDVAGRNVIYAGEILYGR